MNFPKRLTLCQSFCIGLWLLSFATIIALSIVIADHGLKRLSTINADQLSDFIIIMISLIPFNLITFLVTSNFVKSYSVFVVYVLLELITGIVLAVFGSNLMSSNLYLFSTLVLAISVTHFIHAICTTVLVFKMDIFVWTCSYWFLF